MVERLARWNVEVDIAHGIERVTRDTTRGQLVRHQNTHKLFFRPGIVGHRNPHQSVLVLVTGQLVPHYSIGGTLNLAVGTFLAREQEGEPALVVEARIAEIRQDVVAAEVRSNGLVRIHRDGDRLIAARRTAAPVHPRVTGCRRGGQRRLATGEECRLLWVNIDAATTLEGQVELVINVEPRRLADGLAEAVAYQYRVAAGVGERHHWNLDRRRRLPGDRLAVEQPLVGERLPDSLDNKTNLATGQHLRVHRLRGNLRQRWVVAPVQRAWCGDNECLAKRHHRLGR